MLPSSSPGSWSGCVDWRSRHAVKRKGELASIQTSTGNSQQNEGSDPNQASARPSHRRCASLPFSRSRRLASICGEDCVSPLSRCGYVFCGVLSSIRQWCLRTYWVFSRCSAHFLPVAGLKSYNFGGRWRRATATHDGDRRKAGSGSRLLGASFRRGLVEPAWAWLNGFRRLLNDFANLAQRTVAFIHTEEFG